MRFIRAMLNKLFRHPSVVTGNFLDKNERMKKILGDGARES